MYELNKTDVLDQCLWHLIIQFWNMKKFEYYVYIFTFQSAETEKTNFSLVKGLFGTNKKYVYLVLSS